MKKIKITAFQNGDGPYSDILDLSSKINEKYCIKHGINFKKITTDFVPSKLTGKQRGCWQKTYIFKYLLDSEKDTDWFFTFDADSIVVDHTIDLRIFPYLSPKNTDFIACSTYQDMRTIYWNINAGLYFIKNSDYIKRFYDELIKIIESANGDYNDQLTFQKMLGHNFFDLLNHTSFFPRTAFNHESNFIYHVCAETFGLPIDQMLTMKKEIITKKIKEIIS